jgi:hypothetical protein
MYSAFNFHIPSRLNIKRILPSVQTANNMGTQKITAISNWGLSNVPLTIWQISAIESKDWVMSDVSSVAVITLQTTRDVWSTRTYKRKHTHLSIQKYTLSLHKSNQIHLTRCNICSNKKRKLLPTSNTEEEPNTNQSLQRHPHHQQYQQSSDIQELRKNMMKDLFEQMETILNPHINSMTKFL